jgi:crotonobetainyl-CoA:carnitine CoA-transferase CaiB-like acyl-CoA transferase
MSDGSSLIFEWCNTGKRSVALDLRRPEGLAVFQRLAARADVVIHSFKPGVVDRLGVAESDLRSWGCDALYCDVSAFGHGPAGQQLKGYDPIAQAYSGIMDMTGYPDALPARCAPSIVDLGNGLWMVVAVLGAVLARATGQTVGGVQSALIDTAMALVPWQSTLALETGERPTRRGARHELGAPYDLFNASDRPIFLTAANQGLWLKLLDMVGAPELADDPRFGTPLERAGRADELAEALAGPLSKKTAAEWLEELHDAGIPASLVLGIDETVRSDIAEERQWFESVGGHDLVRLPILADGNVIATPGPAPRLGEHTHQVLGDAGWTDEEIDAMAAAGVVGSS